MSVKSRADQAKQTEPNIVSNALKPFIESLGYTANLISQKGQSGIDLAIVVDGKPSVIIEAKKHNKQEMLTERNPNSKALQEAVLYFLREREKGNHGIYHIIITDFYNWFIFDAKEFERVFAKDSSIKKILRTYNDPSQLLDTTKVVYLELGKAIDALKSDLVTDETLYCTSFHLEVDYKEKDLVAIFKLLSAGHLLKQFNPNDANALNRGFYNELLYILGLEEIKQGGKKIISRAQLPQSGSLYENIRDKLSQYGKPNEFDNIIKLIIIWLNRILFLKLLESQIVTWTGNEQNKFLTIKKITQYDDLEMLFFDTLAKPKGNRTNKNFDYIPYLNSSLFEIHVDEQMGMTIANLTDSIEMDYYGKTVVKDQNTNREAGKVITLKYLFKFLDAYDFSNNSNEEIVTEQKSLINPSVLGLIFEKLNGYKDGSFYTPSFITMYMARESIRKSVLDKLNNAFSGSTDSQVQFSNWEELQRYSDNNNHKDDFINKTTKAINSLTICDPAVGSGHFLVSALNEIILIKHELGLFQFRNMRLELHNDELQIMLDDEWFVYKEPKDFKSANHAVQKMLFKEKQRIIENQLFGVDINPNSVNICRLRLWIELLKNAYYKEDGTLETLPNIDINIKCGNSLISRFGLKDDIKDKKIKEEIEHYKQVVKDYKENVGNKHEVMASIDAIKAKFSATMKVSSKATKNLDVKLKEWVSIFGYKELDDDLMLRAFKVNQHDDMFGVDESIATKFKGNQKKMLEELKSYQREFIEFETGKIYDNAFEWRFEFPEVLDENGDYIGFDVVIGNPPYIDSEAMVKSGLSVQREFIQSKYLLTKGNWDIYIAFFERSLAIRKTDGTVAFITPDKWLTKPFGLEFIRQYSKEFSIIIKAGRDVFDSANVDALITIIDSKNNNQLCALQIEDNNFVQKSKMQILNTDNFSFDALFSDDSQLLAKIGQFSKKLSAFATCVNACATSDAYKLKEYISDSNVFDVSQNLRIVNTGTISKYTSRYGISPMTYLKDKYLNPIVNKHDFLANFKNTYGKTSVQPKLIGKGLTLLDWFLDENGEYVAGKSTLVLLAENIGVLKFLCAILNSRLVFFYIKSNYSSSSYNGGVNFTKDMICSSHDLT